MGATGVVIAEYRAKLDELAERLGLTVRSAKAMFHAAIRQRMGPMMQQIMYEFERSVLSKEELARKTGRDAGEDVLGAKGGNGFVGWDGMDGTMRDEMVWYGTVITVYPSDVCARYNVYWYLY